MPSKQFLSLTFAVTLAAAQLLGCATAPLPSAAPPYPLTKQQAIELREQDTQKAVTAAYGAGDDGLMVDMTMNLAWCQYDAQEIIDREQLSAAIQKCQSDWPQPVPGQPRPFTTSR